MVEWLSLDFLGFPNYIASNKGMILNDKTSRVMRTSFTASGTMKVGLTDVNGNRLTVSVAHIIAACFLPDMVEGDNVINMDGNRSNNSVDNLAWRPSWFAKKYHRDLRDPRPYYNGPIEETTCGMCFENTREAAVVFGVLERDIFHSLLNDNTVWPGNLFFTRWVEE